MIDGIFSQPGYLAAKRILDATALRHEAIASNIANLETPNYKRVDLNPNFVTDLQRAVATQDRGSLSKIQPSLTIDSNAPSTRRDGNTVELDAELINLSQNNIAHSIGTHLITSSLVRLRTAVTGRAS